MSCEVIVLGTACVSRLFLKLVVQKEKCGAAVTISRPKFRIIKRICHHRQMRKVSAKYWHRVLDCLKVHVNTCRLYELFVHLNMNRCQIRN